MRIWITLLALSVFLAALPGTPLRAETRIVFGPSPRALDNQTLFAPNTVPVWEDLQEAGVQEILLNGTFLLPVVFRRNADGTGSYPARPEGSYLHASDLRDLARLQRDLSLRISYEAGAGLSGEICRRDLTPEARGQLAALQEFEHTVLRLEEAGIQVAVLNIDGPFLRLIEGSRKRASCEEAGEGFDIDITVRTVQAYLKAMRDLVAEANAPAPSSQLRLVVNLPNWQIRDLPRRGGGDSVDLAEVLTAFADLQAEDPEPVLISEVVVDYPYALVLAAPDLFRDRNRHLWNASRGINGAQAGPDFGYITNSLSYANRCLDHEAKPDIAFLPYLRGGKPISAACQRGQTGEDLPPDGRKDSDADYLRDSLAYAEALRPGGVLADELAVRDGTAIPDHIAHFYMQSWGMNPMRNLWFADRLADYLKEEQ